MSGFNPSQVSFAAGEWSSAMSGRVDLAARSAALARCENFKPRPQGPALMRAGSWLQATWPESDMPRLFEFRVSGSTEDYVVAVGASKIRIYSKSGGLLSFQPNLIVDGGIDTDWNGNPGTPWSGTATWSNSGHFDLAGSGASYLQQTITTVPGATYRLSFLNKNGGADVTIGATTTPMVAENEAWHYRHLDFTAAGASTLVKFAGRGTVVGHIDNVAVYRTDGAGGVSEFASPWTADQLPALQASSELTSGRTFFAHREVRPNVLTMPVPGSVCFELYAASFIGANDGYTNVLGWSGSNWPGVVEAGFQGRLWLASSPDQPSMLWGSRSGKPFNFDLGSGLANEAIAVSLTLRGQVQWVQGQRILLAGSEAAEHAVSSASGLIKTADLDVQDASGFGSSTVQARHIGDQVLFVDQSGRRIRALDYSWEKQAWWSKAITWAAEHLFTSDITEVHFSRAPDPMIIAVLANGELRACTYDRVEGVAAWWRITTSGTVHSAAVARTADGDELWVTVAREGASPLIERIPLHETGVTYLDSAITNVASWTDVNGMPSFPGANHLIGQTVRAVCSDGTLWDDVVVNAFGAVVFGSMDAWDKTFTVGLPYSARLVQLPLEGGLQTGSSQSAKRRRTKVRLRLNDSALPLVNGKRAAERAPADPMNTGTDLITGDVDCNVLGWDDDGAVTIEQDLPFRTEVVAIFGNAQANEA